MFAETIDYDMPLWRPPSEGRNLIIQATIGCSFNRCSFCSMYRTKQFQARPLEEVVEDIERARRAWPATSRVFLADEVLERAALRLSLGPMTWPHLLVRPLLAEQLYRAQCILEGHPYHRGGAPS